MGIQWLIFVLLQITFSQQTVKKSENFRSSPVLIFPTPPFPAVWNLYATLQDLFLAGSETTSTTTEWAVLFLLRDRDVLLKAQREIDAVVTRDERSVGGRGGGRERSGVNSVRVVLLGDILF